MGDRSLTLHLLAFVTAQGTEDGILFAGDAVASTLDIAFGTSSIVFGFSLGMLLPARLLPVCRAGEVANL